MKNIVILEDNIMMALVLRIIISSLGLSYSHFTTPSQAIKEEDFDKVKLIITDFKMLSENVLKLLEYLKKQHLKIPIIIYSNNQDAKKKIEKAGYKKLISEYLPKTINSTIIKENIIKYIN